MVEQLIQGDILSPFVSAEEQLANAPVDKRVEVFAKLYSGDTAKVKDDDREIKSATWTYLDGFTPYKQATSYYCVVASCRSAMMYLTGAADSQIQIASDLGTTTSGTPFDNARIYLNSNQSSNYYVRAQSTMSLETMKNNLYQGVSGYDAPPLISVQFCTSEGWAYNTSGHTMCISGARDDKELFQVSDSYLQWVTNNNASMNYKKSAIRIHDAIVARGNGYIF